MVEDAPWQRLDKWLFCARIRRNRVACAHLAAEGALRVNRLRVEKPDYRLRIGDVVTLAVGGEVRVLRVLALAERRGGPAAARLLYEEIPEMPLSCADSDKAAYRGP